MLRKSFALATALTSLSALTLIPTAEAATVTSDGTIRCLLQGPIVRVRAPQICPTQLPEENTIFTAFGDQGTIVSIETWNDPYAEDLQADAKAPQEKKPEITSEPESSTTESSEPDSADPTEENTTLRTDALYSLGQFESAGVVNWGGYKFTYYSQSVLPGGGLAIPGRHINEGGYVADADGYIVLASSSPNGTVYDTPFGYPGKVYDSGVSGNHLDVYIR